MTRSKLIVGNWKQNLVAKDAVSLVEVLSQARVGGVQLGVAPVYTVLSQVKEAIARAKSSVWLGAQDIASTD